jgi:hypothetical protein
MDFERFRGALFCFGPDPVCHLERTEIKEKLIAKQMQTHMRKVLHCRWRGWDVGYPSKCYGTRLSMHSAMLQLFHRH